MEATDYIEPFTLELDLLSVVSGLGLAKYAVTAGGKVVVSGGKKVLAKIPSMLKSARRAAGIRALIARHGNLEKHIKSYLGSLSGDRKAIAKSISNGWKLPGKLEEVSRAYLKQAGDDLHAATTDTVIKKLLPRDVKIGELIKLGEYWVCRGVMKSCVWQSGRTLNGEGLALLRVSPSGVMDRIRIAFKDRNGKKVLELNLERVMNAERLKGWFNMVGKGATKRNNIHLRVEGAGA